MVSLLLEELGVDQALARIWVNACFTVARAGRTELSYYEVREGLADVLSLPSKDVASVRLVLASRAARNFAGAEAASRLNIGGLLTALEGR